MLKIEFTATNNYVFIDTELSLSSIRAKIPGFFSKPNKNFFKDESYKSYKGQLIVKGSFTGSDRVKIPKITVFAIVFDGKDWEPFNISVDAKDLKHAKKLIDQLIETQQYSYEKYKK